MRTALASVAALLALALVPAPVQAHDCQWDDVRCVTQCIPHSVTSGDTCGVDLPPPTVSPCAADEVGAVVVFDGRMARVCVPLFDVGTAPCPPGWTGIVVLVDGRPVTACVNP